MREKKHKRNQRTGSKTKSQNYGLWNTRGGRKEEFNDEHNIKWFIL